MPGPSPLRGYAWDARASRYRYQDTGRFVARQRVLDLLDASVRGRARRMEASVSALAEGDLAESVFVTRNAMLLKRQYLQNAALGAGGWDRLSSEDHQRMQARLSVELERLAHMAQELADEEISELQARNRMRMYLGGARHEYWEQEADNLPDPDEGMVWLERRTLGATHDHCTDCLHYAAMGYQPVGVLPEPTEDCACSNGCLCDKSREQFTREEAEALVGRVREGGPILAGLPIEMMWEGGPGSANDGTKPKAEESRGTT